MLKTLILLLTYIAGLSVVHLTAEQGAGGQGFFSWGQNNTKGLKITET